MKKKEFSTISICGKAIEKYALFRIIFFGVGAITLFIATIISPQIESLNLDGMSDSELFSNIEGSLFFWLIISLLLIFAVVILGFIVLGMFFRYIMRLKDVTKETASLYLRNILICELSRPIIWIIQLFLIGKWNNSLLYLLNCISLAISIYIAIQYRKWILLFSDYDLKLTAYSSILTYLQIWMLAGGTFIILSLIQLIGLWTNLFLFVVEALLLLLISISLWFFGKKLDWLF
ncbi:hypothetical protein [Candidatus Lokiarchaeum ossiferum]|uniref:hypothetical protein n=1 Tax=Candidatus Lokiarchaeum ossiferum TaxID=2951803 RepID=UPI00352E93B2